MNENCYRAYFGMWILPVGNGKAMVSTCSHNRFIRENRVLVDKNIKDVWNSPQFLLQRKLLSRSDWRFCSGASCATDPFANEPQLVNDEDVRYAIDRKCLRLSYAPKKLVLAPSLRCNNKCTFCYFRRQRDSCNAYTLNDELLNEIKKDIIPYAKEIVLYGGEPFFSPVSYSLIDWILSHYPQKKLLVITNGCFLHTYGIKKIVNSNMHIQISLYGMKEENYKKITAQNNYRLVMSNIKSLLKEGFKNLTLVFVFTPGLEADVKEFCEFLRCNVQVQGIIRSDAFNKKKCFRVMKMTEDKYSNLFPRLQLVYPDEDWGRQLIRKFQQAIYLIRYKFYLLSGYISERQHKGKVSSG